jgi:hypothetical protein
MAIITPRNVAMSDGKFEVSIYRGSIDDRTEFGVITKALVDQNNDWEHWLGNNAIFIGYRMRRYVAGWNGTTWATRGGWQALSPAEYAAKEPVRFNPENEAAAAPGAPMVDRTGLPLFVDGGVDTDDGKVPVQPTQPAQGEPGRDPWSGNLTGAPQP